MRSEGIGRMLFSEKLVYWPIFTMSGILNRGSVEVSAEQYQGAMMVTIIHVAEVGKFLRYQY